MMAKELCKNDEEWFQRVVTEHRNCVSCTLRKLKSVLIECEDGGGLKGKPSEA